MGVKYKENIDGVLINEVSDRIAMKVIEKMWNDRRYLQDDTSHIKAKN